MGCGAQTYGWYFTSNLLVNPFFEDESHKVVNQILKNSTTLLDAKNSFFSFDATYLAVLFDSDALDGMKEIDK